MHINIESSSGTKYVFDAIGNNFYTGDGEGIPFEKNNGSNDREIIVAQHARDVEKYGDAVDNSAKTLTLETTEQCNLRCSYCTFDEAYPDERNHGTSVMSLETAKNAILEFSKRTPDSDVYIVFYGGEPLLRYKFIIESCNYARSIFGRRVKFSFTTNGTLLTDEKIKFIIKENFLVTISLDGDQKTHDKFRFTIKNKGTYDIIKNNLQKLKEENPDFYASNIIFNSVVHSFDSALSMGAIFGADPLTRNSQVRFSFLIQNKKSNEIQTDWIEKNKAYIVSEVVSQEIIKNKFLLDLVFPTLYNIDIRNLDSDAVTGKKVCVPFVNRTYVRTNGAPQFCERIGKYGAVVDNDIKQSSNFYLSEFEKLKKIDCMNCHAYNFCQLCPASFIGSNGYDFDKLKTSCEINRRNVTAFLKIYIDIMEIDPDAIQKCFNLANE